MQKFGATLAKVEAIGATKGATKGATNLGDAGPGGVATASVSADEKAKLVTEVARRLGAVCRRLNELGGTLS